MSWMIDDIKNDLKTKLIISVWRTNRQKMTIWKKNHVNERDVFLPSTGPTPFSYRCFCKFPCRFGRFFCTVESFLSYRRRTSKCVDCGCFLWSLNYFSFSTKFNSVERWWHWRGRHALSPGSSMTVCFLLTPYVYVAQEKQEFSALFSRKSKQKYEIDGNFSSGGERANSLFRNHGDGFDARQIRFGLGDRYFVWSLVIDTCVRRAHKCFPLFPWKIFSERFKILKPGLSNFFGFGSDSVLKKKHFIYGP